VAACSPRGPVSAPATGAADPFSELGVSLDCHFDEILDEEVKSNGDRDGPVSGCSSAARGSRKPQVVQNFAPDRTDDPQLGQRSI
jgi:hypothetical protein